MYEEPAIFYGEARYREYKRRQRVRFSEIEVLDALTAVSDAMAMAPDIVEEAEADHRAQFSNLLASWGKDTEVLGTEPYLDEVRANFAYQYVRGMTKLFERLERLLPGQQRKAMMPQRKAFTRQEPLLVQVERRILHEALGVQRRMQRNLDARRQREAGVLAYIWRSSDDEQVRDVHAFYDDRVFSWDDPPPGGHPGVAYGCRCVAEPLPPSVPAPPRPDPLPTEDALREQVRDLGLSLATLGVGRALWVGVPAALDGIRTLSRNAAQRLRGYRDERLARQTSRRLQDILMPNGRFIGRKGDGARIREVKGDEFSARKLYDELSTNGRAFKPKSYKGSEGRNLPNGDWVGFRPKSKSGPPAIDLKVQGINIRKIHFVE